VEHLQKGDPRARYVKEAIDELARRLGARFGRGFSTTNLRYLRSFLLAYATRRPEIRHIGSDESDLRRQIRRKAGDVSAALVNAVEPQARFLAAEPLADAAVLRGVPGRAGSLNNGERTSLVGESAHPQLRQATWFEGDAPWILTSPEQSETLRLLETKFAPIEHGGLAHVGIGVATGCDQGYATAGSTPTATTVCPPSRRIRGKGHPRRPIGVQSPLPCQRGSMH
jgi:hypothetical protein